MMMTNLKILFPNEKVLFFLLCFIVIPISSEYEVRAKFANEYFQKRDVRQIVTFGCCNEDEKVKFVRSLNAETSYVSISEDLDVKNILKVNYYKLGIFLDLDCPNRETIFNQFTSNKLLYNESYYWLMITKKETPFNLLQKLHLGVDTEMTLALEQTENFVLYDVYNPSYRHGGRLNITHLGFWEFEKGLDIDLKQYKYDRRRNFHGLVLNFSLLLHYPPKPDLETYLAHPTDKHLDTMHRYHYNLILQLRDFYNFSMHMTRATSWGYLTNGTFDGIIGDMVKGIVDIGASPFMFITNRLGFCEFTVQSYVSKGALMFRHPKKNNIRNNFLKPFTQTVWWLLVSMMILIWFLIIVTEKLEKKYSKNYKLTKPFIFVDGALDVMAATCQQDVFEAPRLYSARIVFISLFVWGFMMSQFYSASIVGSLLAEPTRFINTLEDLANSDLEIGLEDMSYNRVHLLKSNNPGIRSLYDKKIVPQTKKNKPSFLTADEGLKRVKKGGFAFQMESPNAYKIIKQTFTEDEICELSEIRFFQPVHLATVTAKNSPFKKMVTYGLRKIVERGTAERLKDTWLPRRPTCPESYSSKPAPIVLKDFFPLIFLMFIAWVLAMIIMMVENFVNKVLLLENIDQHNNNNNVDNNIDKNNSDNNDDNYDNDDNVDKDDNDDNSNN